MRALWLLLGLALAGCDMALPGGEGRYTPAMTPEQAARSFAQVVSAVEPQAEAECRRQAPQLNCDYRIVVDGRRAPPNAFQSVDSAGRPTITFTISLIASVDNADELAFIMSHEAAHHILTHLDRQRRNSAAGAEVFGELATLSGGSANDVARAQELGAAVGARAYSKEFELEADELGTVIAFRAGYNPLIGAGFFARIPDPGNAFLGTHPPNADRLQVVYQTSARLGLVPGAPSG
ncbi:peptidase M48 [Pseudooceanicola lipolyticus]|uniref:Peptidase M48 n=1 Tax=Pseudooceanicola lipolyticus TaxID=2029104 RepID=A0A2M8IVV2_9RHOB|nr:M48 family metalloprotease [Pseudooceanicola lipolyticus]PJE34652.1 peptidase M48 [Pseudooceanicola lipolyticus]